MRVDSVMPDSDYQLYRQRSATQLLRRCRHCRLVRSHCKLVATCALTLTTGLTAASRRDHGVKLVITPHHRDPPDCPSVIPLTVGAARHQCAHTIHSRRIRLTTGSFFELDKTVIGSRMRTENRVVKSAQSKNCLLGVSAFMEFCR